MGKIIILFFSITSLLSLYSYENDRRDVETTKVQVQEIKKKLIVPTKINVLENEIKIIDNNELPKISKEKIKNDILFIWRDKFKKEDINLSDKKNKKLDRYAEEITDAVHYYIMNETTIGGQLPNHESSHIAIAITVFHESRVNPKMIGYKFAEVSMFQMWGVALNGYKKKFVKRNTALAAMLGVRWIAYSIHQCNNVPDQKNWTSNDWKRPLTIYGAGPKKTYKNKKKKQCKVFTFAKERIKDIKYYEELLYTNE